MTQITYLLEDINSLLGKNKLRIILLFFNRGFWGIFSYRLDRSLYLVFKNAYKFIRIFLAPLFYLLQIISNCDIHYNSDIKGGINIHHPSLGIVISGKSKIGKKLTLTGGNVIGIKSGSKNPIIEIGDCCNMGANACIIGPLKLGNNHQIAAMACVVKNYCEDNLTLLGVPARKFFHD